MEFWELLVSKFAYVNISNLKTNHGLFTNNVSFGAINQSPQVTCDYVTKVAWVVKKKLNNIF